MFSRRFEKTVVLFLLVIVLFLPVSISAEEGAAPAAPLETLYIVPFLNVMIPEDFSSLMFDQFVDQMLAVGEARDFSVRILKQELDSVDPEWLGSQHYISGELFAYLEESGCCSTSIEAKARLYRHQPGLDEPADIILIEDDSFFDHDLGNLDQERTIMATRMAETLVDRLQSKMEEKLF